MKSILLFLFAALFFKDNCRASIDTTVIEHFHKIIHLIKTNSSYELSKLIDYPLKRSNPLPDIKNATEFIAHYSLLFDTSFNNLLKQYNDSDIFEYNGEYGLVGGNFSGEIWIDDDGKILGLMSSKTEEQEKKNSNRQD